MSGHGGDLSDALALVGSDKIMGADDWLDLSTGISPFSYPVPSLPEEVWSRLPGRVEMDALTEAACAYYRAPGAAHIVAGPGSQAIIERLPELFAKKSVAIVAPTYGGHAAAWKRAGHPVREVAKLNDPGADEITVLVNPNNPDGRRVSRDALEKACEERQRAGGWLIIDEAFGDTEPELGSAELCRSHNVVVLRSLGKFFGLAGLRLGFAVAPLTMATKLRAALGDWPVSGPALAIGTECLRDEDWHEKQGVRLAAAAKRLDTMLSGARLKVAGGTTLFRLVETAEASRLFADLLAHRIYVRRFDYNPDWLRIGIPGDDGAFKRMESALLSFGR